MLLDTHAVLWLVRGDAMEPSALLAIASAQQAGALYVSAITAWELGVAVRKRTHPAELGLEVDAWLRLALRSTRARLLGITTRIAMEAARVPTLFGHSDPGDCFLIATAHTRGLSIVTRDGIIHRLAAERPSYIEAILC